MTTARWVEHYRVGGERDGLANILRQHAFAKGRGDGVGRLGTVAPAECVRQPLDPSIFRLALAERPAQQPVLIEKFWQERADFRLGVILANLDLLVDTVAHGLTEKRERMLLASEFQHHPGAPRENDAVHVHLVLNAHLELVEQLIHRPSGEGGQYSRPGPHRVREWPRAALRRRDGPSEGSRGRPA